jgi:hypothetical protein
MQTMNISLPDPLKEFVDAQIASGRYSSVSRRCFWKDWQVRKPS